MGGALSFFEYSMLIIIITNITLSKPELKNKYILCLGLNIKYNWVTRWLIGYDTSVKEVLGTSPN